MNIFVDFHHASLLKSFILLFEKRLGGNVYRPIGMEWAEKGYWKVYDHPATQAQYLDIGGATPDGTPPLNQVESIDIVSSRIVQVFNCHDIEGNETNKAITFDGFMELPIDIVIASLPQHIEPYKKICELHPNKPKLIYQIGNQWDITGEVPDNIMFSAKASEPNKEINFVVYHQEFDINIFRPENWIALNLGLRDGVELPGENIYSFVNVFNGQSHFASDWQLFEEVERRMLDFSFKSFGGQCRDGAANGSKELANKMREARFIWHTKNGGDGYGHVLFNSAAVGRPLITKKSYYSNKLGEELMLDGQTCINIDGLSVNEIVEKIRHYNQPEQYQKMCLAVYDNFKRVCNFNEEFIKIQEFLTKLK